MDVRCEVSHLKHSAGSATVICGKGSSNWEGVSRRLKAVAHVEDKLTCALSVRLFYNVTITAGGGCGIFQKLTWPFLTLKAELPPIQSLFRLSTPAITPVPCRCIRTRDQRDWEYALCILSA
jgi:hypothetical protein